MAQNIPGQRRPGQTGGQHVSNWKNKKTLSAAEQVAQQYSRQGNPGGGGGGGGGNKSGGGLCGIITLGLLSVPTLILAGILYGASHLFG